jgi:hypothetical protein
VSPISIRVENFVRECQWFAGESSLATSRDEHLLLVRDFVARLPDSANRTEGLIFRGILVDVASKWARHIHPAFMVGNPDKHLDLHSSTR